MEGVKLLGHGISPLFMVITQEDNSVDLEGLLRQFKVITLMIWRDN